MIHVDQVIIIVAIFACVVVGISAIRSTGSMLHHLDRTVYDTYCHAYEEGLSDGRLMRYRLTKG